jgi:outer membrane lipoprotein carrier protein
MKNLLLLISCLFILQGSLLAQVDTKAKDVLNKVTQNLKSLKTMKADFKISITDKNKKSQGAKSGNVSMKGNKYLLKISGQEIYNNGKTSWTYIKESNEVQINDVEDGDDSFSPSKLFTNFYDKEYAYKYLTAKNDIVFIGLAPLKKTVQFDKIVLKISKSKNVVVGGTVYDKNGNVYNYTISNYTKNPTLTDAAFEFNTKKYPGVETIDLR